MLRSLVGSEMCIRDRCMVNFNQAFVKDPVEGVDPEDPDGLPGATLSDVADHIDHIKKVAGIECAGIGADLDGIKFPAIGLEDVSKLPSLTAELIKRGYSEEEVGMVLGLNAIRVLAECEQVAARLQKVRLASERTREEMDGPDQGDQDGVSRKRHRLAPPASSVPGGNAVGAPLTEFINASDQ
eukprot:TRINITY_DN24426_c0_g1_i3.p1 TRINITY_DN24426_c0_g1~~TRINITY_DN24426_c0_g1_i3.p1  ORF type:complete len:184 (-),score=61.49 TRINITY_DN24426_c0_g1_i3:170-721(-)